MKVTLEFEFDGKVSEEAVVQNIAEHLLKDITTAGIVGVFDDAYTKSFDVESETLCLNVDVRKATITTV